MQTLETLVRDAAALGAGGAPASAEAEAARQLQICNACRYCEGYCAVFPAMTRRLAFPAADVHYLANLCHNCGACLHACQYAPPHDFALNLPRALARVRLRTYAGYAWPPALGRLYARNGLTLAVALAAGLALFVGLALALGTDARAAAAGRGFYALFPHRLMVALFAPVFAYALLALGIGVARFWRRQAPGPLGLPALAEAAQHALSLKYLDGGHGQGCNEADDRYTLLRRRFHHLTFYGFVLCFAATSVATLYHYAYGWQAPYPRTSLPVLLGTVGGLGLIAGPAGLLWLNLRRDPMHGDPAQRPMDRGFIALLLLTSASGLALLAGRDGGALPVWLALHLGAVMALFLTLPYGKFAHGLYRGAALLKWAIERRRPSGLRLGPE
ncbi:MAG: tricarballylate utilization 4Fe-4S protein TcuB [Burkholderiales bacterium]|nr:tricarballylate utilization 4Fe-4S protein TcuB [Burkholderiales bacterium]